MTTSAHIRVPHLRDSLTVAKMGIVRTHDRFLILRNTTSESTK